MKTIKTAVFSLAAMLCMHTASTVMADQNDAIGIGIFTPSGNGNMVEVKIKPDFFIASTETTSSILYTIRWEDQYNVGSINEDFIYPFFVVPQGQPEHHEGYYYQVYAATPQDPVGVDVQSGEEILISSFTFDGDGCVRFELVNDDWTHDNNASFYVAFMGTDVTGHFYNPVASFVSEGGFVTGNKTISLGDNTGTMSLHDFSGDILTWQKRHDEGAWSDIPGTSGDVSYSEIPESSGIWQYRAKVQKGDCPPDYAEPATIIVTGEDTEIYTVSFTVEDEDKNPVQGAVISITGISSLTTGAGGTASVELEDGSYVYEVTADGYVSLSGQAFTVDGQDLGVGVTMTEVPPDTYLVTFTVEDEDKNPVQGAVISITGVSSLTTGAGGTASVELEDGSYVYGVTADGYVSLSGQAFTVDGQDLDVNVTMTEVPPDTYLVSFKVQDEKNRPVAGAIIHISGSDNPVTGTSGTAAIRLADGSYQYEVTATGYIPLTDQSFTVDGAGKQIDVVMEVVPPETYMVTFYVQDADNNPIEDAAISITGENNLATDADGLAGIEMEDGTYQYEVTATGYIPLTDQSFTVDGAGKQIDVVMEVVPPETYIVTFYVQDEDNNPVQGAVIAIADISSLTTGAGGTASVELEDGSYVYSVTADGYVPLSDQSFTVDGEDKQIDITITELEYSVTFMVKDEEDNSIDNAVIKLNDITNDPGFYTFAELTPGNYGYTITAEGYFDATGSVSVIDDDVSISVTMITEAYTVTFYVSDIDGNTIDDAVVELNDKENTPGNFVFENIEPGTYDYTVGATGYFDRNGTITVTNRNLNVSTVLLVDNTYLTDTGLPGISLYPNPAVNTLNINSKNVLIKQIMVTDAAGHSVYSKTINDHNHSFCVSSFKRGVYFICIQTCMGVQNHKILIVN